MKKFLSRDYFGRTNSSLSCFSAPQGLFRPPGCISILLFCSAGIISAGRIHLYLALFLHRDYFGQPDSSLSCSFSSQGLFRPPGFISILLFCATWIISASRIHLYLALFLHRDYFGQPDSSLPCSFSSQGLFRPAGFIPILLFFSTGIISASRIHPYLAFFLHRDYFGQSDSSLACSFSPQGLYGQSDSSLSCSFSSQGLFRPAGFIPILLFSPQGLFRPAGFISILLFFFTGIISAARIHLYLALLCYMDYFGQPDSSLSCSFSPQGLFRPAGFIFILLFFSSGIISAGRIHLYLALFLHKDYFGRPDSSLSCSFSPQGLFRPARFISILLFSSTGIISASRMLLIAENTSTRPFRQIPICITPHQKLRVLR